MPQQKPYTLPFHFEMFGNKSQKKISDVMDSGHPFNIPVVEEPVNCVLSYEYPVVFSSRELNIRTPEHSIVLDTYGNELPVQTFITKATQRVYYFEGRYYAPLRLFPQNPNAINEHDRIVMAEEALTATNDEERAQNEIKKQFVWMRPSGINSTETRRRGAQLTAIDFPDDVPAHEKDRHTRKCISLYVEALRDTMNACYDSHKKTNTTSYRWSDDTDFSRSFHNRVEAIDKYAKIYADNLVVINGELMAEVDGIPADSIMSSRKRCKLYKYNERTAKNERVLLNDLSIRESLSRYFSDRYHFRQYRESNVNVSKTALCLGPVTFKLSKSECIPFGYLYDAIGNDGAIGMDKDMLVSVDGLIKAFQNDELSEFLYVSLSKNAKWGSTIGRLEDLAPQNTKIRPEHKNVIVDLKIDQSTNKLLSDDGINYINPETALLDGFSKVIEADFAHLDSILTERASTIKDLELKKIQKNVALAYVAIIRKLHGTLKIKDIISPLSSCQIDLLKQLKSFSTDDKDHWLGYPEDEKSLSAHDVLNSSLERLYSIQEIFYDLVDRKAWGQYKEELLSIATEIFNSSKVLGLESKILDEKVILNKTITDVFLDKIDEIIQETDNFKTLLHTSQEDRGAHHTPKGP